MRTKVLDGYAYIVINSHVFSAYKDSDYVWFRLLGIGLHFRKTSTGELFSHRYGHRRRLKLFGWFVSILYWGN